MTKPATVHLDASPTFTDLVSHYQAAKAAADAAAEVFDGAKAQLKLALENMAVQAGLDQSATALEVHAGMASVRTTPVSTWRVDATRLKAEQPLVYASYAKQSHSQRLTVTALED